jgi:hypothetical protein
MLDINYVILYLKPTYLKVTDCYHGYIRECTHKITAHHARRALATARRAYRNARRAVGNARLAFD